MRLSQDVICYESVMEEARRRGLVHKGSPIMCKPNPLVRPFRLWPAPPCSSAACHTIGKQMAVCWTLIKDLAQYALMGRLRLCPETISLIP